MKHTQTRPGASMPEVVSTVAGAEAAKAIMAQLLPVLNENGAALPEDVLQELDAIVARAVRGAVCAGLEMIGALDKAPRGC